MEINTIIVINKIANFICSIYSPTLAICGIITIFMSILVIHEKPYMIISLLVTRKFQPAKKNHKYAVVIPARNEEPVIKNLINSIKKQDYPSELVTIFVIADNCTDNTAKVARENGAICYEHFNPDERTKGFALKYGLWHTIF